MQVPVTEIFESIQGEGRFAGISAVFVRLAGCNLDCTWCDSRYALDVAEAERMTAEELAARVAYSPARHAVITGGEPLMRPEAITAIAHGAGDRTVEIETNGTIDPELRDVLYAVSPKLPSTGVAPDRALRLDVLRRFLEFDAAFKFVVADDADWDAMADVIASVGIPRDRVWVMPEGRDDARLRERALELVPRIVSAGYALSPRLQVWLWGDERGT